MIVDDVFRLILAQIRSKHETAGDFRAQIAANMTGARRLQALVDRHGRATIVDDDGRAARLHRAPHPRRDRGAAARRLRGRGLRRHRRLHRRARAAEGARRDLGRTASASTSPARDPQRRAPVNSTYAQTFSACAYAREVPDRPRPAGQRRLLPRSSRRRAGGQRHELHLARARSSAAGRRRRGSSTSSSARSSPRFPSGCPRGRRR